MTGVIDLILAFPVFRLRIIRSLPMSDLTLEKRFDLYRFMRVNRALEERLVLLYWQGKDRGRPVPFPRALVGD
jgi:TPP-dependent pyruvate/acetoin dehydrogenase alpha subunit